MAGVYQTFHISSEHDHGLRFVNDEWNDSIANGDKFLLKWNASVVGAAAQLGLFKVTYPKDGVVVYEFTTNLTEYMESNSCDWEPDGLSDELYALWLTATDDKASNWTISPPWKPVSQVKARSVPSVAPFIIPICSLLVLYAICLATCFMYRKRKKARALRMEALATLTAQGGTDNANTTNPVPPSNVSITNGSDSTTNTARTFVNTVTFELVEEETDEAGESGTWLCTTKSTKSSNSHEAIVLQRPPTAHERALADSSVRFVRRK